MEELSMNTMTARDTAGQGWRHLAVTQKQEKMIEKICKHFNREIIVFKNRGTASDFIHYNIDKYLDSFKKEVKHICPECEKEVDEDEASSCHGMHVQCAYEKHLSETYNI